MNKPCRRFVKRGLITLAALTAVSTTGFAMYTIGGFNGNAQAGAQIGTIDNQLKTAADNLAGTAQNLTSEKILTLLT